MPPSPGKIHSLPVKVLYSIDTSSQSYLTVLHDRQDVYVHPGSPIHASNGGEGPIGSCTLKTVARGICFASPECIPNSTSLDFSVYNLDPSIHRPSAARAFPSSPNGPSSPSTGIDSWTGKGFLSWVLSESGSGSTLIKGRLVREYEFSSTHFAPQGGLEGLMALANSNNSLNPEDQDGKGWGLEVGISLRQLNPDGKVEFQNRREFEDMLQKGKSTSISSAQASSPLRPNTGSTPARSSPLVNGITRYNNSNHRSEGGNRTPNINSTPQQPGPSASSTATVRPPIPIAQPSPIPVGNHQSQNGQSSRPSSSLSQRPSSTTMPPSSLPALPSSSNMPSSRPSSSIGDSRQSAPPPQQPIANKAEASTSQSQAGPSIQRNRQVTPPPIPRSKSPPPSTPSRSKLHALLRADGMMSPELARHLASNPVLRNLLKAVPTNSTSFAALRNMTGINKSPSSNVESKNKTKKSLRNGNNGVGSDDKDKDNEDDSPEATTPTPSHPPLPTPGRITRNMQDGCCNCGTLTSSCWRTKKMKDGTPRKVCDDCGLYFNEHKRMRPPELWSQPYKPGSSSTLPQHSTNIPTDTKRKHAHDINDGPASGLRSSPRLNRTNSDKETHTIHNTQSHQHQHTHQFTSTIPESPSRKRQKTKAPPPPSPRRATRASTRAGESNIDFGAEVFGFSPTNSTTSNSNANSLFSTSPAIPVNQNQQQEMQSFGNALSNMNHNTSTSNNNEELDLTAFLATFENSIINDNNSSTNENGILSTTTNNNNSQIDSNSNENENFSLDNLFNGLNDGMSIELSQEMQDLLNGWETQLSDPNYLGNLDLSVLGSSNNNGLEGSSSTSDYTTG
ncbi:uncharacterized protein L201_005130 [Kwoniella dendrophila CBS 6074]|uniref:GATA-type domain-containing protein n=1 Tax=Kwoniella dendrophila CBS 6074 TaxID=1295534 RepID=A0AAX4JXY0_9TREE